jgi:hypothetical protein
MLTSPARYRICVKGHLGEEWSEWFDRLAIDWDEHDDTILVGQIVDQAALYGILNKICDLGLPLISVTRLEECR